MMITVTDPDGIEYDVDVELIESVNFGKVTEIFMHTGEILHCIETYKQFCRKVVMQYVGGW